MKAFDLTGMKSLNIKTHSQAGLLLVVSASMKCVLAFLVCFYSCCLLFSRIGLKLGTKEGRKKITPPTWSY